jgi:hypothetical protein
MGGALASDATAFIETSPTGQHVERNNHPYHHDYHRNQQVTVHHHHVGSGGGKKKPPRSWGIHDRGP